MITNLSSAKCWKDTNLSNGLYAFLSDSRGNVGTMLAVVFVPLLIGVGVAVDYGNVIRAESKLQNALDDAVLAGKESRLRPEEEISVADKIFQANYKSHGAQIKPKFSHEGDVLHGTADIVIKTAFGKVVDRETVAIAVKSAATSALDRGPVCFMAMHPTRAHTLELVGTVSVLAPGCNVYGNSSHEDDVVDPHNEENFLTAKSVQAIGYGHHYIENVTPPLEYAPELIPDLLSSMVIPSASGACLTVGVLKPHGMNKLYPGTYCDGIELEDAAKVRFEPGMYIISGGDFEVSGVDVKAKGVTFVLKDGAEISWEESDITIEAPKTGTYAGIAIMGDRIEADHEMEDSNIDIHGLVYLPQSVFQWYNLGNFTPKAKWTAWIIDGVTWGGEGTINIPFDIENGDVPYPSALLHVIPRNENIRLVY